MWDNALSVLSPPLCNDFKTSESLQVIFDCVIANNEKVDIKLEKAENFVILTMQTRNFITKALDLNSLVKVNILKSKFSLI